MAALVAELVKQSGPALRAALRLDVSREEVPSLIEERTMRRVMEAELGAVEADLRKVKDAKRKADGRLETTRTADKVQRKADKVELKAHQKDMRAEIKAHKAVAKAKYRARLTEERAKIRPSLEAAARGNKEADLARAATWRNRAAKRARDAEDELGNETELSTKRLRRAEAAEEKLAAATQQICAYREHYDAALDAKRRYGVVADRVAAMPTWRPVISGRGNPKYELGYRVTIYSMHANGTPLSAIGPNIQAVVRCTAPWLDPKPPSRRMLTETRFEQRTIEEALGGHQAASAHRICMLGFDESIKYGDPAITSNQIVESTPGAELKVVILRAVYCSAGGTAAAVSQAIETKCFARLRDHLRRWQATFERLNPDKTWTGPDPRQLSLGRLAGGAVMSDSCNTARLTQTLLADMIAKEARELIGAEEWELLSEREQAHQTRVHKLNCWQHLRNIFLKEMSSAQVA